MPTCCAYRVASNDSANLSAFLWADENLALAHGGTQVPVTKNYWCAELLAFKSNKPLTAL